MDQDIQILISLVIEALPRWRGLSIQTGSKNGLAQGTILHSLLSLDQDMDLSGAPKPGSRKVDN
jgi:hypothetical protein